ncbi:hypothetical protein D3C85_1210740 [compost metagenome]
MGGTAHGIKRVAIVVAVARQVDHGQTDQGRVVAHRGFKPDVDVAQPTGGTETVGANVLRKYQHVLADLVRAVARANPGTQLRLEVLVVIVNGVQAEIRVQCF